MKIAVTTACCFPNVEPIKKLQISADRFGIELKPYGVGTKIYKGWVQIKLVEAIEAYRGFRSEGYTHVLYTDGRDSFFVAGMDEIEQKFRNLGNVTECFMSAEKECYPLYHHGYLFP